MAAVQDLFRRLGLRVRPGVSTPVGEPGEYPSNDFLETAHDTIPNFAKNATILSNGTGNWGDASTWDLGRIPTDDDIVGIQYPHVVTYNVDSTARIHAVGIAGTLKAKRDATTKLMVKHLVIYGAHEDHGGYEGFLDYGTTGDRIQAGVTAQILGLDEALEKGTSDDVGLDPEQYGNGLICLGKIRMCGQTKTPFIRLAAEPLATDDTLTLDAPVTGWNVNDTLVLPDSRQYAGNVERPGGIQHRWESRLLDAIDGTEVTLDSALTWDHPCAREAGGAVVHSQLAAFDVDLYPHVANVTRNVRIASEDGTGVRWHTFFTARADVDIRYTEFEAMGRTTNATVESTVIQSDMITGLSNTSPITVTVASQYPTMSRLPGQPILIEGATGNTAANGLWSDYTYTSETTFTLTGSTGNGTYTGGALLTNIADNQKGRYMVHSHHLYGPVGGQGDGRAFKFIGCTFHDSLPAPGGNTIPASKWFLTLHGSSYGTIEDCVIHHAAGAGLMTEDGSEYENIINRNLVMNTIGDISQRTGTANGIVEQTGRSGIGFMFTGFGNRVTNNIACGCVGTYPEIVAGSGFYWNSHAAGMSVTIPDFVGADPSVDGTTVDMTYEPLLEVSGNEAYGAMYCWATIWHLNTSGYNSPAADESVIENTLVWHMSNLGWFGYPTNKLTFDGFEVVCVPSYSATGPSGVSWGDYRSVDTTFRNTYLRYVLYGLYGGSNVSGYYRFEDTEFEAYLAGAAVSTAAVPGVAGPELLDDNEFIFDNVLFTQVGAEAGYYKLVMDYSTAHNNTNLRKINKVTVTDFDQVPGDDFRVYFTEQDPDFEMPETGSAGGNVDIGCPESGLTNAEAYVAYEQNGDPKVGGSLSDPTGCAIAGAVCPEGVTTRASIDGFILEV